MILPATQGSCDQPNAFIYAACDSTYFDDFGYAFVNSILKNTTHGVHMHIFNPTDQQHDFCKNTDRVSITYEYVSTDLFKSAAQRWNSIPASEPEKSRYDRTLNAMGKGNDRNILERMQKTYYACARFIRLAEINRTGTVLAIDVDAVVRKHIPVLSTQHDFYVHHISGRKARYLAGGFWLNPTSACDVFLKEYARQMIAYFNDDYIYWGLDQDLLDPIVPKFNHGQLPISYIDWDMRPDSFIWTAKGTRKDLAVFVNEKQKYSF